MELQVAIRRRRMVRAFEPRPVDPEVLERILDAACRAPSAGNTQAVDLLVVDDPERYWDVTLGDRRDGFRWQGLFDAPVLVIPVVEPDAYARRYSEPDKATAGLGITESWSVPYWWVDGGMAVDNMLLAAVDEGLGALFFGLFDHEPAVLAHFGVPIGRRALGAVALGHPRADEPGRSAGRPRRGVVDAVHFGRW